MNQPLDPLAAIDELIAKTGGKKEDLISILQELQGQFRYLPGEALRRLAERSDISAADIEGVASFYSQFRRKPVGRHIVKVCHGTACHVKGAQLVDEALRRQLRLVEGEDTDADGLFTIESVACVGCCSIAPVIQVDENTFGHLTADSAPKKLFELKPSGNGTPGSHGHNLTAAADHQTELRIAIDSCCAACGSLEVLDSLTIAADRLHARGTVKTVSCTGVCHLMPMIEVAVEGLSPVRYANVRTSDAEAIVHKHLQPGGLRGWAAVALDSLVSPWVGASGPVGEQIKDAKDPMLCAFLGPQRHIAMEYGGELTPLDLDGYIAAGGFDALAKVRKEDNPLQVIAEVSHSGLRGRGGAGFPTGTKWERVRASEGTPKYLVCNGDEGDPGAFMDRMLLESFPFRVLEGMAIAAFAMDIQEGVLYIRAEYPHAVRNVKAAIEILEERGILGGLKLRVVQGAGAFVCGEETALIASIEGKRGTPSPRPPYPSECGLFGKPTCVNNVESYALVPWIIRNGADAFSQIGTEKSKGTKVFALAGAVRRGGLIEVPMGTTIRQIVEDIGGGVADGRSFKAVLIGGPSGGCVPASLADTPVDYDALQSAGAIMGSGGLVVLDDRSCVVDVARYFIRFTQNESCGKCTMCRLGTRRMMETLDRICEGEGREGDLEALEDLAGAVKTGSLCGLGQTAPNPILSTLRHFREEYQAHLEGRCPAGRCSKLIHYRIKDNCIGCTLCSQSCPVGAIAMRPHERHEIDDSLCVRCDTCREVCPEKAVSIE